MQDIHFPPVLLLAFEAEQATLRDRVSDIPDIYSQFQTDTGKADFAWMGDIPIPREWFGDKIYREIRRYTHRMEVRRWYNSLRFSRDDVRRDQFGMIQPRMSELARSMAEFQDLQIVQALVNGSTNLAYDKQAYFANRTGMGNPDNLIAGTGTGLPNIKADLQTCRKTMANYTTDTGWKLRHVPDTVFCSFDMEDSFVTLLESPNDPTRANAAGVVNTSQRYVSRVIPSIDLTDTNDWYYLNSTRVLKALIWLFETLEGGVVVRPSVETRNLASGAQGGHFGFSADMYGAAGYGLPFFAQKVVNV